MKEDIEILLRETLEEGEIRRRALGRRRRESICAGQIVESARVSEDEEVVKKIDAREEDIEDDEKESISIEKETREKETVFEMVSNASYISSSLLSSLDPSSRITRRLAHTGSS